MSIDSVLNDCILDWYLLIIFISDIDYLYLEYTSDIDMDNINENIHWIYRLCINVYMNKNIDKSDRIRSIDFIFDFLFVLGGS